MIPQGTNIDAAMQATERLHKKTIDRRKAFQYNCVMFNHIRILIGIVTLLTPPSLAHGGIRPTWPIEYAVERADIVILGNRGTQQDRYVEITVEKILSGNTLKKGDVLLVPILSYDTVCYTREDGKLQGIDLKDRPILLCLSRKIVDRKNDPANAFEIQTTGHGTAIKIIDGLVVFGYYQQLNPGPYSLMQEGESFDRLLQRIDRAVEIRPQWAKITAIQNPVSREDAILKFLEDRTLPSHFCWQACVALSNAKLIAVIRDEVDNVKDPPADAQNDRSAYPNNQAWPRLACALAWVENDGKTLLPLLQQIKAARPRYHDDAVRCAASKCGTEAIPFLKQAILDSVETDMAVNGLCRIGTADARIAVEATMRKHLDDRGTFSWMATRYYASKWPESWKMFAGQLNEDFSNNPKVQAHLKDMWSSLARVGVLSTEDIPPHFKKQ